MLRIKNSLDWPSIDRDLEKLGKMLPDFKHDIVKIQKHLREEITTLSKLEVDLRSRQNSATVSNVQRQVEKINNELKKIEQHHLMAILAKG